MIITDLSGISLMPIGKFFSFHPERIKRIETIEMNHFLIFICWCDDLIEMISMSNNEPLSITRSLLHSVFKDIDQDLHQFNTNDSYTAEIFRGIIVKWFRSQTVPFMAHIRLKETALCLPSLNFPQFRNLSFWSSSSEKKRKAEGERQREEDRPKQGLIRKAQKTFGNACFSLFLLFSLSLSAFSLPPFSRCFSI